MKRLKMAISLFTLFLLWSISASPVAAGSAWSVVGLTEPDKATSSTRLELAKLAASARMDQVCLRPRSERLPPLPRWYPPPLSGRKSSRQKRKGGQGRQGQNQPRKPKKRRLSVKQSQTTGEASKAVASEVVGGAGVNTALPAPLSGANLMEATAVIVNGELGLDVNTALRSVQASVLPHLSPAPVATTQRATGGGLAVEKRPDASPDSLSAVTFPDPEVDREWAKQQWASAELGDQRRTRRAVLMGERMALNPGGSIPAQMGSWGATKAAYLLLNETDVTLDNRFDFAHCKLEPVSLGANASGCGSSRLGVDDPGYHRSGL